MCLPVVRLLSQEGRVLGGRRGDKGGVPSRLQALEIKQALLSTNLASLALEPQAPEPTFANRFWCPREAVLSRCLAEGGGTKWSCRMIHLGGCEEPQFMAHWR